MPVHSIAQEGRAPEQGLKKELPAPLVQTRTAPEVSPITILNRDALQRASELAHKGDHAGAAKTIAEVEARLGAKDPFVDELRGTVLTLKRDYAGAEASFRAMLAKQPHSHVARFNVAEVLFLRGRFADAEKAFGEIEASRRELDPAIADLCRFKRVVCFLAQGRASQAEGLLPKSESAPSSPAVTFSRAAIRFATKSRADATVDLEKARKEFSKEVENLYVDSFIELGWGARDAAGMFQFAAK